MVTDLTTPELTGDQLAARIQALRPGMPVVLCTGLQDRCARLDRDALGIRAILAKPFSAEELAASVRAALDGRGPAAEEAPG